MSPQVLQSNTASPSAPKGDMGRTMTFTSHGFDHVPHASMRVISRDHFQHADGQQILGLPCERY